MTHNFNFRDEVTKAEVILIDVVERKVKAATTVATLTGLGVSLLGLYVFHGVVPDWATAGVGSVVVGVLTAAAGWLAKHTPRVVTPPDPPAPGTGPGPAPGSIFEGA